MEKTLKVKTPVVPEYIFLDHPGVEQMKIWIGDLSADEARQYAELMAVEFMFQWECRKNAPQFASRPSRMNEVNDAPF